MWAAVVCSGSQSAAGLGGEGLSIGVSRGRGCLAVIRGLPASLVFPLSWSFLQMGAEWRGVRAGPGTFGKSSAEARMGAPTAQALKGS